MPIKSRIEKLEDRDRYKQEIGIFFVHLREGETQEDGLARKLAEHRLTTLDLNEMRYVLAIYLPVRAENS
jgi:hypothetical protein